MCCVVYHGLNIFPRVMVVKSPLGQWLLQPDINCYGECGVLLVDMYEYGMRSVVLGRDLYFDFIRFPTTTSPPTRLARHDPFPFPSFNPLLPSPERSVVKMAISGSEQVIYRDPALLYVASCVQPLESLLTTIAYGSSSPSRLS
jgi:hypothetical protein